LFKTQTMVADIRGVGNNRRKRPRNPLADEITDNRVVQFRRIQPKFVAVGQYCVINLKTSKIAREAHVSRCRKECSRPDCWIKQGGRALGDYPIFKINQTYDRIDAQGAREQKTVFVTTPAVAIKIGDVKDVNVAAQLGVSSSKKYVTHSIFSGGRIVFTSEFLSMLTSMRG
jgi:hypothetical protein